MFVCAPTESHCSTAWHLHAQLRRCHTTAKFRISSWRPFELFKVFCHLKPLRDWCMPLSLLALTIVIPSWSEFLMLLSENFNYCGNSAAWLVSKTGRYEYITPVLKTLHWLPMRYRIYFKITFLLIKPCKNWFHHISATGYRYVTQQGHWGLQEQIYCLYCRLSSIWFVPDHSTMQHPHYGINSWTNWDVVIQLIVLDLSLRRVYYLVLYNPKFCNVYVCFNGSSSHLYLVYSLFM